MTASSIFFLTLLSLAATDNTPTLKIYTYDSMMAKGGLGEKIAPLFEPECHCKIELHASGDAVQMLSRAELESRVKENSADILLGIDQSLWGRAKKISAPFQIENQKKIKSELSIDPQFLPIDYGVLGFMVDTVELKKLGLSPPRNLKDLLDPKWKRHFLLEDPRTSAPGLNFLLFTNAVLQSEVWTYWRSLKSQWLTLAHGWTSAYGLFTKGEAPVVWSYTTSEAYHRAHGDPSRYKAITLEEGAPLQIEGAVLMKSSDPKKLKLATAFLNFLLSEKLQNLIPKTQWMLSARADLELPKEFKNLPTPKKLFPVTHSTEDLQKILKSWSKAISGS
jgi:thiamine transport system substrate-binding protein